MGLAEDMADWEIHRLRNLCSTIESGMRLFLRKVKMGLVPLNTETLAACVAEIEQTCDKYRKDQREAFMEMRKLYAKDSGDLLRDPSLGDQGADGGSSGPGA